MPQGAALGTAYLARVAAGLEADASDAGRWARTEPPGRAGRPWRRRGGPPVRAVPRAVRVGHTVTTGLLPEPSAAEIAFTVISVDDHLVEPRHLFEGRMPTHLAERAPYVRTTSKGNEIWVFDGQAYPQVGLNAVVGRSRDGSPMEPVRFDQMRRGCWDPTARVADMDLAGIWASVSFPSQITGFCGAVYSGCSDPELGQACVRAWNDWFAEEWREPYPDRFVGLGIVFLADPDEAAAEIRRNAARGFTRRVAARAAPPPRVPVAALGLVGPGARRLRRDRHRRLPARRQLAG